MRTGNNRASGQLRIIGGQWRGRKLPVIDAEGLRPTTDRTKETLFNWLMHDIRDRRCLDAFAGSGSLGIEALSRGAKEVIFFDTQRDAIASIKSCADKLGIVPAVFQTDSISGLKQQAPFDGVFADPPFNKNLLIPFVQALLAENKLKTGGWLYVEHEIGLNFPDISALELHREKRTGQFRYALYFRTD